MTRSSLRRPGALPTAALAALLMIAALSAVALAAKPHFSSTVSAKERFDSGSFELVFYGRVHSPKGGCAHGRKVQLRAVNIFDGRPPITLGTDSTDRTGYWEIRMLSDGIGGDYVARAVRKSTPNFVCKSARSDPVDFGPPT